MDLLWGQGLEGCLVSVVNCCPLDQHQGPGPSTPFLSLSNQNAVS